jgi:hypothetical protein
VRSSFCGSLMVGGEFEDGAKHEISRKKSAHVRFYWKLGACARLGCIFKRA